MSEVKWYITTHCSRSGWNTHMQFELKELHAWELSAMFKARTIFIWFQRFDLISFLQQQQMEKKTVKVN